MCVFTFVWLAEEILATLNDLIYFVPIRRGTNAVISRKSLLDDKNSIKLPEEREWKMLTRRVHEFLTLSDSDTHMNSAYGRLNYHTRCPPDLGPTEDRRGEAGRGPLRLFAPRCRGLGTSL